MIFAANPQRLRGFGGTIMHEYPQTLFHLFGLGILLGTKFAKGFDGQGAMTAKTYSAALTRRKP